MDKRLEKSVIATLAYFDYFNHPLNKEELFRCLFQPPQMDFNIFCRELEDLAPAIQNKHGFYFLSGRGETVAIRRRKTADNDYKQGIARRAARKLRWVPFIRAVLVCNNTSWEMAEPRSDIDVVIIVRSGRMWTARLLATLWLNLFGLRRHGHRTTNRICLSFYATDKYLDFSSLTITNLDVGFMYWIAQFTAIYDPDNLQKEILEKNSWIKKYLPHALQESYMAPRFMVRDGRCSRWWKRFWEKAWGGSYGDLVEQQARSIQKAKMKRNLHSVQDEPDTRVVISDDILKFHENDRRLEYKKVWLEKLKQFNIYL